MTSDIDPATPTANAMRVFGRLVDAYLVVLQGGPHVIFDWGYPCVDDLVANYLATGEPPATRVTICNATPIEGYVPIAPDSADELAATDADPIDMLASIDDQLHQHVEYVAWSGEDDMDFGCDFGGVATFTASDVGADLSLESCELTDGYPISGSGSFDDAAGGSALTVTTPSGDIDYSNDGSTMAVVGTWHGEPVDEARAVG